MDIPSSANSSLVISHPHRARQHYQVHPLEVHDLGSVSYLRRTRVLLVLPVNKRKGSSHLYQNDTPCGATAILCSTVAMFDQEFYLFTGKNLVNKLLDQLIRWETDIVKHLKINCRMRVMSRNSKQIIIMRSCAAAAAVWKAFSTLPSPTIAKSLNTIILPASTSEQRIMSEIASA